MFGRGVNGGAVGWAQGKGGVRGHCRVTSCCDWLGHGAVGEGMQGERPAPGAGGGPCR